MAMMNAPIPMKEESEVSAALDYLTSKMSELRVAIDALETRLIPILPEMRKEEVNAKEAPNVVGNACQITRSIENSMCAVNEAIMHVHKLMDEIRI